MARYTLFAAHPVLGSIMALVAKDDLEPGEEVLCNYGYLDKDIYINAYIQGCICTGQVTTVENSLLYTKVSAKDREVD